MERLIKDRERQMAGHEEELLRRDTNLADIQQILEQERRKSAADQEKIRKLQNMLENKKRELKEQYDQYLSQQRKTDMNEQELNALRR